MSRKSDSDYFIERFEPITNPSSQNWMWETYGEELEKVKLEQESFIWTIIDGPGSKLYLIKGYHFINRFGYVICKKPWTEKDRDYLY